MIKIDKGVPLPASRRGSACVYPWRDMAVGDSFWTETKRVQSAARNYGLRHQQQYTTRREGNGWRVWRVR